MIKFKLTISSDSKPVTFEYTGSFEHGNKQNYCGLLCQIGRAVATIAQAFRLACMGRDFKDEVTQNLMDLEPDGYGAVLERCLHSVETYNEKGYKIK